jgi:hypothetical protein
MVFESIADPFRQIGHDERVHKEESIAAMDAPPVRIGTAYVTSAAPNATVLIATKGVGPIPPARDGASRTPAGLIRQISSWLPIAVSSR